MSATDDYERLKAHLIKLEAHRRGIAAAKKKVGERAVEQHDSSHAAIDAWTKEVEEGRGGILAHRRLRTLLTERNRLAAIVHRHQHTNE